MAQSRDNHSEGTGRSNRGFASMDPEKQRAIASKGGQASGGNFANDPARAAEAGRKGGQQSGGNFANDPSRAAEAGRKGGQASGGQRQHHGQGMSNMRPQRHDDEQTQQGHSDEDDG